MYVKSRIFASVALAAGIAVLASGCASGGASGTADANTFEFWSFTGIGQKDDVAAYEEANPDITVKLTEVGGSTETAQALTTSLAGGKVPDLVLIQGDDLPKFVENPGNFVDLRTLGADDIEGDYLDWVWSQSVATDGAVIGVPTDVGGMAMAYRTDLFAAAGLPTDPASVSALWPTWEDYIATGEKYVAASGRAFVDNAATSVFSQAVNQGDEKYYSPDGELVYADNPQVEEAFDLAVTAATSGITARLSSFSDGWSAGMPKGDFATLAAPSWMLGAIKSSAPDTSGQWNIATIPGGSGNWGGSYLAIPKGAKNPTAAWNYIKEMQSPDGQLAHFERAGSLPTTPSIFDAPALTDFTDPFFSDAPVGTIYTSSLEGLKPFLIGSDSGAIGGEFTNAITNVEQGGGDPAEAWDSAIANIKTAIGG